EPLLERSRVAGRDRPGPPAVHPAHRQVPGRDLVEVAGAGVLVAGAPVQLHGRREQGRDGRPTLVDLGQVAAEQVGRDPPAAVLGPDREPGHLAGRHRPAAPEHRPVAGQQQAETGPALLQHPQLLDPGAGHRAVDADAGGGVTERLGVLDHQGPVLLRPCHPVPACHPQPPRRPVRPYQPARRGPPESVTAAERPGNLPATPLRYLLGVPVTTPKQKGVTALDSGDTAFVLISAALVMFMIPGLALFYGGMVRAKNVLATVMQSFFTMGLVSVLWVLAAYSLAFSPGNAFIGGLHWLGFSGVGQEPNPDLSATVPAIAYAVFQLFFA